MKKKHKNYKSHSNDTKEWISKINGEKKVNSVNASKRFARIVYFECHSSPFSLSHTHSFASTVSQSLTFSIYLSLFRFICMLLTFVANLTPPDIVKMQKNLLFDVNPLVYVRCVFVVKHINAISDLSKLWLCMGHNQSWTCFFLPTTHEPHKHK